MSDVQNRQRVTEWDVISWCATYTRLEGFQIASAKALVREIAFRLASPWWTSYVGASRDVRYALSNRRNMTYNGMQNGPSFAIINAKKIDSRNMSIIKHEKKNVIIHIGPHKTGSTAIQNSLKLNRDVLEKSGVFFLHDEDTHRAALCLAKGNIAAAKRVLARISKKIASTKYETIVLSQEDFSGDLPGRSSDDTVYGSIIDNIKLIDEALIDFRVKFVFFVRDQNEWLTSCYHQNLQFRHKFKSYDEFVSSFTKIFSWDELRKKIHDKFGEKVSFLGYSKDQKSAGFDALISASGVKLQGAVVPGNFVNRSPSLEIIELLERCNRLTEFGETSWFAKKLIIQGWEPRISLEEASSENGSGPSNILSRIAFPELSERSEGRISRQISADILPDIDVNFYDYIFDILSREIPEPKLTRSKIEDQSKILEYHLRGKSRLSHLNALTISYLRRDTPYTDKAKIIFHRIWNECGVFLINEMSTRWLISTLQTFADHGMNANQRVIGSAGHFYGNMLKIYEGERAIEGISPDATYERVSPVTKNKFRGLDRYNLGGTDLHLNTNALALDYSRYDDAAGIVLIELLLRVKSSANVFTRMDKSRKSKGIEVPGFEDTWSFFVEP